MYLTQVELVDFRNYEHGVLELGPGANLLTGANGQGKTNIVEAITYMSRLASYRVATDAPLVRLGADRAVVRGRVVAGMDDARALTIEIEISPGQANRTRLNKVPQRRARDLLGALKTVAFTPDDLAIVKGDPAERRAALDDVLVQRWPRLAGVKTDYDRVIRQRNALLKSVSNRGGYLDGEQAATLEIWDERLAQLGAELMIARAGTIADMLPLLAAAYQAIAPANNSASIAYAPHHIEMADAPGDVAAQLLAAIAERRADEVRRGVSLVGPHRDEVEMTIGPLPAKGYASHGEAWSLALSWRLAAFELLSQDGGRPVLLLDDVFAELDAIRRDRLAAAVGAAEQIVITAAVEDDVPPDLRGRRFAVQAGTVTACDPGPGDALGAAR